MANKEDNFAHACKTKNALKELYFEE